MAIEQRKPKDDLLWHSDRGSQYASGSHLELLAKHHIKQSMSRKGNCWDTESKIVITDNQQLTLAGIDFVSLY